MINDSYIELLIKRKTPYIMKIIRMAAAICMGLSLLLALIGFVLAFIPAILFGVASYFLGLHGEVEYEYTYVDRELQIDRILGRSKRKRMETLDLVQLEVLAPLGSHQLDGYRGRMEKCADYSSGEIRQPEARYLLVAGNKSLIIEPSESMIKMIQSISPRKVFTY